uniref:Uncharacterized protein n=1 Tax=Rhizophora mucronata TaxID=61149 RepID=A0A2P2QAQ2_RHIMU
MQMPDALKSLEAFVSHAFKIGLLEGFPESYIFYSITKAAWETND